MKKTIERKNYTDNIKKFIDKDIIKIITGIRRCGKSEILNLIKEEILKTIDENHIIFINFENLEFEFIKTFKELNDYVLSKMVDNKKHYLFFDEIQIVDGWEKAIASLKLKNTDIYITGSNSKLLSSELSTFIGGRYVQFEIKPLSFHEFISFRIESNLANYTESSWQRNEPKLFLDDYIKLGGFPFVSTHEFGLDQAVQIVKDIHSSIVLKDVVARNRIKNIHLLEKIIAYFYDNIGNLTSLRKIAEYISGGDKKRVTKNLETISNYVSYLEAAYIIKKVSRYDIKGKRVFETNDKYYLADHSLAYVMKDINKVSKGGILENIVYNELIAREYKVYVGKLDTKEIDFIAEKDGEKIYIQVCLEFTTPETYNREFSPLKMVKDNFPKYVVSLDSYASKNDEGIIGISLKDFLLKKELFG